MTSKMGQSSIKKKRRRVKLRSFSRFFVLVRFKNLIIISFTQLMLLNFVIFNLGEFNGFHFTMKDGVLILSTIMIAASGYIINDYYDVKIDYLNRPKRVIIGKWINRRYAMVAHLLLSGIGVIIGFYISWQVAMINFACAFLLYAYSNQLKRVLLIGNVTVAFLTACCLLIFAAVYKQNVHYVLAYAIFAFFIHLIREIIKDMEDMDGDAMFGCRTLPLVYGISRTKRVIYFISTLFFGSIIAITIWINNPLFYSIFILISAVYMVILWKIKYADTKKKYGRLSRYLKLMMLIGVFSMVFI